MTMKQACSDPLPPGTPEQAEKRVRGGKLRRWDIIIVSALVAIALLGYAGVRIYGAVNTADNVKITSPDGVVYLSLDKDTTYTVTTDLGYNTIVIENRTVRIDSSDCKNQICVEEGAIDTPGQTIVCLPHKVVVQIVDASGSDSSSNAPDTTLR